MGTGDGNSILLLTDGNVKLDLLQFNLVDWVPQTAPWKDGGIWSSSPFSDNQRMVNRQFTSVIDTFTFNPSSGSQDSVITKLRTLQTLLEKAVYYQTTEWQNEPVWLEARGNSESEPRYALVLAYSMPQLDNWYEPPFGACNPSTLEEFTLAITHDLWMSNPPGEGECVPINTLQEFVRIPTSNLYNEVNLPTYAGVFSPSKADKLIAPPAYLTVGRDASYTYSLFMVFNNLPFRHSDIVTNAHIDVVAHQNSTGAGNVNLTVTAVKLSADFNVYGNQYTARDIADLPRYSAAANISLAGAWTALNSYSMGVITSVIQACVDDASWEYGDSIMLIFDPDTSSPTAIANVKFICTALEGVDYHDAPKLDVTLYENDDIRGREDTCAYENYITLKHAYSQITHLIYYDAGALQYTNTVISPTLDLPYPLLGSVWGAPAVNDILYIGVSNASPYYHPFENVIFDMGSATGKMAQTTQVDPYYYGNVGGAAWKTLTPWFYDESQGFNLPGVRCLSWKPPSDWVPTTVNGVTGYFIRLVVTSIAAGSSPEDVLGYNRLPYSQQSPYIDIKKENIGGDVAAIAQTILDQLWSGDSANADPTLYLSVRSLERGKSFSPFLNCASGNQPRGLSITTFTSTTLVSTNSLGYYLGTGGTPFGTVAQYAPPGIQAAATRVLFDFDENLAKQYSGRYAVYLRYDQYSGGAGAFTVNLFLNWGGYYAWVSPVVATLDTVGECIYLGDIDLTLPANKDEKFNTCQIGLQAACTVGTSPLAYFYDLILIPIDEYVVMVQPLAGGSPIKVDSYAFPKRTIRAFNTNASDLNSHWYTLSTYSPTPWMIQSGDQRVWLMGVSGLGRTYKIKQNANYRYALSARGKDPY